MTGLCFSTASRLRPTQGLTACGDAVIDLRVGHWHLLAIIDALGHGPEAQRSALTAQRAVQEAQGLPLAAVFQSVHRSLASLRGVAISAVLMHGGEAMFAGVGNVAVFAPAGVSRPESMDGTLGGGPYRFRAFPLAVEAGQRWALASDGIRVREGGALLATHRESPAQDVVDAMVAHASTAHDDAAVLIIDVEAAGA